MNSHSSVRFLPADVVSRIAAGEVVERPASVVKELLENAIDAGADVIDVISTGGGIELIQVTDNGTGISAEDIEPAFGRHATSKITSFEDMYCLSSLGFRGEALPSIAAVSEMEISSSIGDSNTGTFLRLHGGEIIARENIGRQRGTSMKVKRLFANVPARLKFLKTTAVESGKIARIVSQYALAYPEIKFSLQIDGKTLLRTTGSNELVNAISQIYGPETANQMLELNGGTFNAGLLPAVDGMVSVPALNRATNDRINIFVNRRWVNMRGITWAVEQAYHGLLMTGRHPVAVINLHVDPGELDVNVHPGKHEIKFRDESGIFTLIQKAVRQTITQTTPVPQVSEKPVFHFNEGTPAPLIPVSTPRVLHHEPNSNMTSSHVPPQNALPVLRVIGQYRSGYIVTEGPDGLYIIDQHAAHERVRFEQLWKEYEARQMAVQPLLEPVLIEISPEQSALIKTHLASLNSAGFTLEPFGAGNWMVRTVPAVLTDKDWKRVILDVIDTSPFQGKDFSYSLIALSACHSAVRFGQMLDIDEMRELIKSLEKVTIPHSCPHGRPLMINLTEERLIKEFRRT